MTDHPDDTYAPALEALCEIVDTAKACGFADPVDTLPQWLAGRMDALRAASLFIEQSTGEHAELTAERDRLAGDTAIYVAALQELRGINARLTAELADARMELRNLHRNNGPLD